MEWIRSFKEKRQTERESYIHKQSEEVITLSDFAGSLYIAYNGTPFVPVEETWTSKEIIEKLNMLRQNYINAKIKELC